MYSRLNMCINVMSCITSMFAFNSTVRIPNESTNKARRCKDVSLNIKSLVTVPLSRALMPVELHRGEIQMSKCS